MRGFFTLAAMTSRQDFRLFIDGRMPELSKALGPLGWNDIRLVLNAMTGLSVKGSEEVKSTLRQFLIKLIEMEAAGTLYSVGIDAAMKEVRRIRKRESF